MLCHVVSWSGCGWRICCGPFGHGAALSGRRSGVFFRLARFASSAGAFRCPGPAAGAPAQRNPFPRVSRAPARAPGRARYAAARIARPIAPARARAKRSAPPSASTSTSTIRPAGGGGAAPEPDPAGGQDFVLRAGEAACDPVQCHGLSCFVMPQMRMAHVLWSFRAWSRPVRPALRGFRPVGPASRLRQGRLVPPAPPPALLCSGTLCRAYRARLIVPARATPRRVMFCHAPDAAGAYAAVLSDMEPPFPAGVSASPSGYPGFASSAGAFRSPGPATGPPVQRKPFPRVTRVPPAARYAPCHVLSWSTLRMAHMLWSFRVWSRPSRPRLRGLRPVGPASRLRQSRFVAPAPPPARLCSGTLSRAYRVRAPGRARCAKARVARPIAPARARAKRSAPPSAPTSTSTIRPASRTSPSGPARTRDPVQCHVLSCSRCGWRICCGPFGYGAAFPSRGSGVFVRLSRLRVFGRGVSFPRSPPPARLCSGTLSRAYRVRLAARVTRRRGSRARLRLRARGRNAGRWLRPRPRLPRSGRREAAAPRRSPIRQAGRIARSGPARPRRRPAWAAEPFSARIACAPGRARYAAARFARLIAPARARAKRRAHLSRQLRRGSFSRRRETGGEAAPRTPFPSTRPRVSRISRCQSLAANASGGAGGCLRRQPEPPDGSSRAGRRLRPRPRLP